MIIWQREVDQYGDLTPDSQDKTWHLTLRPGDVVVTLAGSRLVVGDINTGRGSCGCCSIGYSHIERVERPDG
jgi:hypothetical protein